MGVLSQRREKNRLAKILIVFFLIFFTRLLLFEAGIYPDSLYGGVYNPPLSFPKHSHSTQFYTQDKGLRHCRSHNVAFSRPQPFIGGECLEIVP